MKCHWVWADLELGAKDIREDSWMYHYICLSNISVVTVFVIIVMIGIIDPMTYILDVLM